MSKIQHIKIQNFKAIDAREADFKGCTAIITGGNNKGKTSFLRGIPDRIRFVRPDVMVKEGADKGSGEMVLTTGEKFIWKFDVNGTDTLQYITKEGIKMNLTKQIGAKFFPPTFDIDKFLQSSPKEQSKQLQSIIGIDFSDIDSRYKIAYDDRTEKNRDAEKFHAKLVEMLEVPRVEAVDLTALQNRKEKERTRLNDLYVANKNQNDFVRKTFEDTKEIINKQVTEHNDVQRSKERVYDTCKDALDVLMANGYKGDAAPFVEGIRISIAPTQYATDLYPSEPTYIDEMPDRSALDAIDEEILQASQVNIKAAEYQNYLKYKQQVQDAKDISEEADKVVKAIEAERAALIKSAKFPKGIAITPEGITVDGFPLDRNQISTSKLYITGLRIAAMNLGEVKTLYFDASFLDRNSLAEIEAWADDNDLQLLIERPDFDGGDIRYEIIETIPENIAKAA